MRTAFADGDNTQLKVHFVNRYFYPDHSATSQLLSDLAFFLAERGVSVVVHSSRQLYDCASANLPRKEVIGGVQVRRVWTSRFGREKIAGRVVDYATFYLTVLWQLATGVSKGDILVAETDPPIISSVAAIVARLRKAVLVNWCQDLFPEVAYELGVRFAGGPIGKVLRLLRNWSLRVATVNVVVGSRMAERLVDQGVSESRIVTVHNWTDGDLVKPIPRDKNLLRDAWGLRDRYVVGYSGNLGRAHEFETVLTAAILLKGWHEIVFVFIGDGARRGWVEDASRKAGLTNILFKPYQPRERLAESLSVADLHFVSLRPELEGLIVPSKFYGIAAVGRPTLFVGAPDGEIAQIVEREHCGKAVAIGDGRGAARFIRRLATDPTLSRRLGENARATFERTYDLDIALRTWGTTLTAVYRSIGNRD